MSLLSFLLGERKNTAGVAKERLQIILAHERGDNGRSVNYLPALQKELIAVISKYVKVRPEDIRIQLERKENLEVLKVKIELPDPARP
jgi:cell division topological specificity factor